MLWNSNFIVYKVLLEHSPTHFVHACVLCLCLLSCYNQRWLLVTKIIWPIDLKIFTIWHLKEKKPVTPVADQRNFTCIRIMETLYGNTTYLVRTLDSECEPRATVLVLSLTLEITFSFGSSSSTSAIWWQLHGLAHYTQSPFVLYFLSVPCIYKYI